MSDIPKTRAEALKSNIDPATRTVTIERPGSAPEIYFLDDLTPQTRETLSLRGLRDIMRVGDATTWSELKDGIVGSRGPAKPRELDPWRESAARVRAESLLKSSGFKAPPRVKLTDTAEYKSALDDARQVVAGWNKATLLKAKTVPDIQRMHADLSGNAVSVDELFTAPSTAEVDDSPDEMAEAAD